MRVYGIYFFVVLVGLYLTFGLQIIWLEDMIIVFYVVPYLFYFYVKKVDNFDQTKGINRRMYQSAGLLFVVFHIVLALFVMHYVGGYRDIHIFIPYLLVPLPYLLMKLKAQTDGAGKKQLITLITVPIAVVVSIILVTQLLNVINFGLFFAMVAIGLVVFFSIQAPSMIVKSNEESVVQTEEYVQRMQKVFAGIVGGLSYVYILYTFFRAILAHGIEPQNDIEYIYFVLSQLFIFIPFILIVLRSNSKSANLRFIFSIYISLSAHLALFVLYLNGVLVFMMDALVLWQKFATCMLFISLFGVVAYVFVQKYYLRGQ